MKLIDLKSYIMKIMHIIRLSLFTPEVLHLVSIALFVYWIFNSYRKIDAIAITKYRIDLPAYENKLQNIYNSLKESSIYVRNVEKVEVEDMDNVLVSLGIRKEIFYVTDGDRICSVSDDNKIMRENRNIYSLPVFFYPQTISCKIMSSIDERLFKYYETVALNIKTFPYLRKIKVFYLKPSYDVLHIYFWIDNNVKFYAGYFPNITREVLKEIDKRLGVVFSKMNNIKDMQFSEVDLSFRKIIVKIP